MKWYGVILPFLLLMLFVDSGCCGKKREDPNKSMAKLTTAAPATVAVTSTTTTTAPPPTSPKATEKLSYPKKVTSQKKRPNKSSLNKSTAQAKKLMELADTFKDLPADDLEFIKELDKQFKRHGDKIKIKVERENITDTKNSKRTIEGELGYGSYHNGYEYARPKFMFYPYSQTDIPAEAPGYYPQYEQPTSVTIEPSYSYELNPQTYVEHHHPNHQQQPPHLDVPHAEEQQQQQQDGHQQLQQQQHEEHVQQQQHEAHVQQQQQQHEAHVQQQQQQQQQQDHQQQQQQPHQQYDEPVIVLRIPGPAKYASHLQTLLQQYLEIRAAQYLRILEEAELRKQQQHQTQQQQQQQVEYEHPSSAGGHQSQSLATGAVEEEHHHQHQQQQQQQYQQEVSYTHQMAPTPQSAQYPAIDDVYQSYKGRQHQEEEQHQQQYQPQAVKYYTENVATSYQSGHHQQHLQQHEHPQQQQQDETPQYYYMPEQQYVQMPSHGEHSYQNVYYIAMSPQSTVYGQPQQQHHQQQQQYYEDSSSSSEQLGGHHHLHQHTAVSQPITENNPRSSHTKVVFTPHQEDPTDNDYGNMYPLPSIRPYDRHAPSSTPLYHQSYQQHTAETATDEQQVEEHAAAAAGGHSHAETVAITQRPFNYHAHVIKQQHQQQQAAAHSKRGAAAAPVIASAGTVISERTATVSAQKADQQLDQIRDYVRHKLGAQTGSSVEFKTTKVVKA